MKKNIIIAGVALMGLLAACSGNKSASSADTDSAFISAAEEKEDSILSDVPQLTDKGIGAVRVGMSLDSLPQGIDGLYDRTETDDTPDAHMISCYLGGELMFNIYDFGENKVDVISVLSPRIDCGGIHIGDAMQGLIALGGVTTEYAALDESGEWYWRYKGLWITPDPAKCTPALIEALSDGKNPPSASLFPDPLPIAAISTGLTF